jgi:O-antigen ligase/tetratricopeptide (TPR) repeat protein
MNRLLLQLWAFAFLALLGTELLGQEPILRAAVQVAYAVPLGIWAIVRLRDHRRGLDLAILIALAALTLTSITGTDRQGGLESVGLAVTYALAFWFLRDGIGRQSRTLLAVAGAYAFTGWVLLAAVFWLFEKVGWVQATGTVPNLESAQVFVWGTANAFPILAMIAAGCIAWLPPSAARRSVFATLIAAAAVAVPLSAGRAGWLGIASALVAWEALGGWPRVRAGWRVLRERGMLLPAGAAASILVVGGSVLLGYRLIDLISANLADRFEIWRQALGIFDADPVTGGGPTTYSWLRLVHVLPGTYAVPVRLAHNVPLQTVADGGLVLATAFGALIVTFVLDARQHLADPRRRASLAVLVGVAAASLLDDFSSLPAVMVTAIGMAAWCVQAEPGAVTIERRSRGLWLPIAVALIGAIAMPSVVTSGGARIAAADGRSAAVVSDWEAAALAFDEAARAYPEHGAYWLGLGLAAAQGGDRERAIQAYQRALTHSPGDPRPYGALAALSDDPDEEVRLLRDAASRSTSDPQYAWRLGRALEATSDLDGARDAYARAVVIERQLIGTVPTALRADVLDRAVGAAVQMTGGEPYLDPDSVAWDLGLALDTLPDDAGSAWRAVDAARHRDAAEAIAAVDAIRNAPIGDLELRALAAVARYQCDLATYQPLAALLGPFRPTRLAGATITRDHVYRDLGLGSYQPGRYPLPDDAPWPWSLVGEPPACVGWP